MRTVEIVLSLVVLATIVAAFAQRLSIPAPSLLVVAGLAVGLIPGVPTIRITPDVVSVVVLPPLLYAAGEDLVWREVRRSWRPVAVLSVGLVVASAAAVAAVTVALTDIPPATAFVLGAVLASTDPVAVTALGRRLGLPGPIQALVQAESLFNDATSLVLFRVAVSVVVAGGSVAWGHAGLQFLQLGGGGAVLGAIVAVAVIAVRRRIQDPVIETVAALVTPYLAYVAAEAAHTSGVTAVVVASLVIANRSRGRIDAPIRLQVDAVYNTVIFGLESVVFAVIGLQLPVLVRHLPGRDGGWPLEALALAAVLVAVRAVWVFGLAAVGQRVRGDHQLRWRAPAVVSWAGARGVVPLAAALSVPLTVHGGGPLTTRPLLQVLATVVIALTLVVQGVSLGPLVGRSGLRVDEGQTVRADRDARQHLASAAQARLEELARLDEAPRHVLDRLRDGLDLRREAAAGSPSADASYRRVRRQLIAAERDELERLHRAGAVDEPTRLRLQRALDLEDVGLDDRRP